MIRLTNKGDVYIAPEQIISIEPGDNGYSQINTVSGVCFVTESPEEVVRKVLEWKLLMKRYQAYTESAACDHNPISNDCWELSTNVARKLFELAGLKEEPNHDP